MFKIQTCTHIRKAAAIAALLASTALAGGAQAENVLNGETEFD